MEKFFKICGASLLSLLAFIGIFFLVRKMVFEGKPNELVNLTTESGFYSNAYSDLVATHVGLFTALIAVSIAVFGVQKWFEHIEIEKVKTSLPKNIQKEINVRKNDIIEEIVKTYNGTFISKIIKREKDLIQSMVEMNLSFLEGNQKQKYCVETIKFIWNNKVVREIEKSIDPLLNYHLILVKLFTSLDVKMKDSLLEDETFKNVIICINGKMSEMETRDFITSRQFESLKLSVRTFL